MNGEVSSEEGRAGGQQEQHAQLAAAAVAVTHILAFLRAGALLPRPRHVSVGVQLGGRQHVQAGVHRQPAAGGLGKGQAAGERGYGIEHKPQLCVNVRCEALQGLEALQVLAFDPTTRSIMQGAGLYECLGPV